MPFIIILLCQYVYGKEAAENIGNAADINTGINSFFDSILPSPDGCYGPFLRTIFRLQTT